MSPLPPSSNLAGEPMVGSVKGSGASQLPDVTSSSPTLQRKEKTDKADKTLKGFSRRLSKRRKLIFILKNSTCFAFLCADIMTSTWKIFVARIISKIFKWKQWCTVEMKPRYMKNII